MGLRWPLTITVASNHAGMFKPSTVAEAVYHLVRPRSTAQLCQAFEPLRYVESEQELSAVDPPLSNSLHPLLELLSWGEWGPPASSYMCSPACKNSTCEACISSWNPLHLLIR